MASSSFAEHSYFLTELNRNDPTTSQARKEQIIKCTNSCGNIVSPKSNVSWRLLPFCNEFCLLAYQKSFPTTCNTCKAIIQSDNFGKYFCEFKDCNFGFFCSKSCYDKYNASIRFCVFCSKVKCSSNNSKWVVASLVLRLQLTCLTFCSHTCYTSFAAMANATPKLKHVPPNVQCTVCKSTNVSLKFGDKCMDQYFCDKKCLAAYAFVSAKGKAAEMCMTCKIYYSKDEISMYSAYHEGNELAFSSIVCRNVYIIAERKIAQCNWCKTKMYNFDMVTKYDAQISLAFCCFKCQQLYQDSTQCVIQMPKISNNTCQEQTLANKENLDLNKVKAVLLNRENSNKYSAKINPMRACRKLIKTQRNVATMCMISTANKHTSTKVTSATKKIQTDPQITNTLIPVPVPIYVPAPVAMFSLPTPVPVLIPIPIPVPIFLPTVRNSIKGIFKELESIRNRTPNNIYEAEMLQLAGILVKDQNDSDSDFVPSDKEDKEHEELVVEPEANTGITESLFDFEWAMPDNATEIPPPNQKPPVPEKVKKRAAKDPVAVNGKRPKHEEPNTNTVYQIDPSALSVSVNQQEMRLDYTLGINAWKQWVMKKTSISKKFKFNTEILEMTPEELSSALCLFVRELRKPNGDEYAPDTIYYLCLGIQYYLDQNKRHENIFFDEIYDAFTDCLDEFAKKFCALYDDESHFIVTRVEEEHLWETKQLGCYSPYVLLNTLIYFNTKYYYRSTVDQHAELSFCHILKSSKRYSKANSVLLRFYPKSRKPGDKRVYEQLENPNEPLRCPVKLYAFYLSKCPESVKNRFDMMYLTPEKHCLSDSPLWYSTTPLSKRQLEKMVNRVKMVKEVNVALLTNQ
ncbi:unnamed protein product [Acanthoscelides obtectus]|uniref:Zinc finger MYM-type protein 3 n=1 Tax=Acanthoscelides obtectus TaxID=200917 RepID=A0A9P0LCP5_ACAOB|nr:unnamed protein product [Acanthoscelides obtectus]CAK1669844.1 Zinc finger MYM-type protein 3 [Acanthoscelides obtectus]